MIAGTLWSGLEVMEKISMVDQTADTIANEVLLSRDAYSGTVLLVEGDTDVKVFRRFAANSDNMILPTWGKQNAIDAVRILESFGANGFLAIVDADFDHLDGPLPTSDNILLTDQHDIEMMIIRTNAFHALLEELGSRDKIELFSARLRKNIRDSLLEKTVVIGHLRRISISQNLNLRFEDLHFDGFIDKDFLALDIDALVTKVLALTRNPLLKPAQIRKELDEALSNDTNDPYQICCGHDFLAILGLGLRKAIGSRSAESSSPESLGISLRLSYDFFDFKKTKLYKSTRKWAKRNNGYVVFK